MANYYTTLTAEKAVPCTKEEFEELKALLAEEDPDAENFHGFSLEFFPDSEVYLFSEEDSFDTDEIPDSFLAALGKLIHRAGWDYLECGVAFTCDRARPDSHGGTRMRIYPDGQIEWAEFVFTYVPRGLHEQWQAFDVLKKEDEAEHPTYSVHDWQEQVALGNTRLGYWDAVWEEITHQCES